MKLMNIYKNWDNELIYNILMFMFWEALIGITDVFITNCNQYLIMMNQLLIKTIVLL